LSVVFIITAQIVGLCQGFGNYSYHWRKRGIREVRDQISWFVVDQSWASFSLKNHKIKVTHFQLSATKHVQLII